MELIEKILVIRLKSIGDVIFTLPAVNRLRAAFPEARLSFLVSREHAALLQGFPAVDEVLTVDRRKYRRFNFPGMMSETIMLCRRLRQGKFSLVVDLQGYGETGLITRGTGASVRWGTVYRRGRAWAYTKGVRRNPVEHPAASHLDLLTACGVPAAPVCNTFVLPAAALDEARRFLKARGVDEARPMLYIQPFTSSPEKDWGLERYLAVAAQFRERGRQVLFGGGPQERAALELARHGGFAVSAGAPLLVTAGLMALATGVLGGDTGVLHLAVAMGKRVVMLMRSSGPGTCHPFQHADWAVVPKRPGQLQTLELDTVQEACSRFLN